MSGSLADYIANALKRARLDEGSLADQLGYSSSLVVRAWLAGKAEPPLDRLPALANMLGVNLGEVLRRWIDDRLSRRSTTDAERRAFATLFERSHENMNPAHAPVPPP